MPYLTDYGRVYVFYTWSIFHINVTLDHLFSRPASVGRRLLIGHDHLKGALKRQRSTRDHRRQQLRANASIFRANTP